MRKQFETNVLQNIRNDHSTGAIYALNSKLDRQNKWNKIPFVELGSTNESENGKYVLCNLFYNILNNFLISNFEYLPEPNAEYPIPQCRHRLPHIHFLYWFSCARPPKFRCHQQFLAIKSYLHSIVCKISNFLLVGNPVSKYLNLVLLQWPPLLNRTR